MLTDGFFHIAAGDPLVLTATDDLDRVTAIDAGDQAVATLTGDCSAMVIDLAGRFVDTSGVRALERIGSAARSASVRLRIIGVPEWLPRMAPFLALRDVPLCADLETAVAQLRSG